MSTHHCLSRVPMRCPRQIAITFILANALVACWGEPPVAPIRPASTGPAPTRPASTRPVFISPTNPTAEYTKSVYRIPMRDGVRLSTTVFAPKQPETEEGCPIFLNRTPYGSRKTTPSPRTSSRIFVEQDVRGRGESEGTFVQVRPLAEGTCDESTDAYDTIEWLVTNVPASNKKVVVTGGSYDGFYSMCAAINPHPALRGAIAEAPVSNWWVGDDFFRNGAFNLSMAFGFLDKMGRPRDFDRQVFKPVDLGPDSYQFFLEMGPLKNAAGKFNFDNPYWKEFSEHPNYDQFWRSRNLLPHLKKVGCPVLVTGGWHDSEDLYGALHTYQQLCTDSTCKAWLVMGPWSHLLGNRSDQKLGTISFGSKTGNELVRVKSEFLSQILAKKNGDVEAKSSLARVFDTGRCRWATYSSWPPPTRSRQLYLGPNHQLSWSPPHRGVQETFDQFVSDPASPVPYSPKCGNYSYNPDYMVEDQRYLAGRPDVLVYQSEPLTKPLTVAGPIPVTLSVSTDQTDCDWIVKLIDVSPKHGPHPLRQTLVRGEPFRGRFREGGEVPKPFISNQPTPIHYQLNDIYHTFAAGHRLMVQVHSTWFPYIDRNPQHFVENIFRAEQRDFVSANHRVYFGESSLALPILDQK